MSEHIYLTQRNTEIRRLRFEERLSAKEVAARLRDRWPEISVWVVFRVARVSQRTNPPKDANQKHGGRRNLAVE